MYVDSKIYVNFFFFFLDDKDSDSNIIESKLLQVSVLSIIVMSCARDFIVFDDSMMPIHT